MVRKNIKLADIKLTFKYSLRLGYDLQNLIIKVYLLNEGTFDTHVYCIFAISNLSYLNEYMFTLICISNLLCLGF